MDPSLSLAMGPSLSLAMNPSLSLAMGPSLSLAMNPSLSLAMGPSLSLAMDPSLSLAMDLSLSLLQLICYSVEVNTPSKHMAATYLTLIPFTLRFIHVKNPSPFITLFFPLKHCRYKFTSTTKIIQRNYFVPGWCQILPEVLILAIFGHLSAR